MKAYRIRDWAKRFENSETRKIKYLKWVPVPNEHDGAGYRALWENFPESPEIFGGFILLLELASRCFERGLLVKDGKPITTREMALKTGAPESLFVLALQALTTSEIAWIEEVEIPAPGNPRTPPDMSGLNRSELKGIELKGKEKLGADANASRPKAAPQARVDCSAALKRVDEHFAGKAP